VTSYWRLWFEAGQAIVKVVKGMGLSDIIYGEVKRNWKELGRIAVCAPYYALSLRALIESDHARESYGEPLLIDYLKNKYSRYDLLTCNNLVFPITVFQYDEGPLNVEGSNHPLLGEPQQAPKVLIEDREYYRWIRSKTDRHNNDTFVMNSLSTQGTRLELKCGISNFFAVARSSLPLEWELLKAVSRAKAAQNPSPENVSEFTPLRNRLHGITSDPIVCGKGRAAAVGISVLLSYSTAEGVELFMRARGKRSTPPREYMYHVLPSAFFQAPFKDHTREYSLGHVCLWEYYEEFFDKKEPKKKTGDSRAFFDEEPVKELRDMLSDHRAELYITGIAVDLLTLRPEVLLLLYIKDTAWYSRNARNFKFSDEHASPDKLPTGRSATLRISFAPTDNEEKFFGPTKLTPKNMVPPGATGYHRQASLLQQMWPLSSSLGRATDSKLRQIVGLPAY
jgi:hypothetical protein